jgi:hypothetical protein
MGEISDGASVQIYTKSWSYIAKLLSSGRTTFTTGDDGNMYMYFYTGENGAGVFSRPQLELAATYTSNEEGGEFFSGSTMPLQ